MNEVECPYCEHSFELETSDGNYMHDDESEDAECPKCEKLFMVHSTMGAWYHEAFKADCLNGEPHNWSEWHTYWQGEKEPNIGKYYERRQCDDCEKTETEWHDERLDPRESTRF